MNRTNSSNLRYVICKLLFVFLKITSNCQKIFRKVKVAQARSIRVIREIRVHKNMGSGCI